MINWQDDTDIFGRIHLLTQNSLLKNLRDSLDTHHADLNDCLSWGQLKSKRWLIDTCENLSLDLDTVFLCAGWYAILANMLFNSRCNIDKIRSFDIDETCQDIADCVNKEYIVDSWRFKAITEDICNINYTEHTWSVWSKKNQRPSHPITDVPNTIINTSCEHLNNFHSWYNLIPSGKLLILQNNNFYDIEEHYNCVSSLQDFSIQTPMTNILYEGELELKKYKRFMRIGYK